MNIIPCKWETWEALYVHWGKIKDGYYTFVQQMDIPQQNYTVA